jgi:hypothetical protein
MTFSRPQPPDASANPERSGAVEAASDSAASQPEPSEILAELARAEREAEELLEQCRRELEQAQAAEWDRWTSQMEANLQAERRRREQLEAALQRTESQRGDWELTCAQWPSKASREYLSQWADLRRTRSTGQASCVGSTHRIRYTQI